MLSSDSYGNGERLVFVHGFTQTRDSWRAVTKSLCTSHEIVLVDAPNHGDSSDISLDLESGANAIIDVGGEATYIGYSLGARLCLTAALAHRTQVTRLVLVSGTAGIDEPSGRRARIESDEHLASRIAQIGISVFIDEWLTQPMFSGLTSFTDQRELRVKNTALALSSSLRLCGTGKQQPTWSRLKELTMPVLIVAGANDLKYVALALRLAESIGSNAKIQIVADAGHSPQLEQPEAFIEIIKSFVDS